MSNATMSIGGGPDISPYWSIYPIHSNNYPEFPMIPWKNPFEDLTIGSPVEPSLLEWIGPASLKKKERRMSKDKEKLAQIKGLTEGTRLVEATDKVDALLEKILQVIEE